MNADSGAAILPTAGIAERTMGELYRTIVADPPWDHSDGTGYSFGERDPRGRSGRHSPSSHSLPYPVMPVSEIEQLRPPAADDAHLYLWTTNRYLQVGRVTNIGRAMTVDEAVIFDVTDEMAVDLGWADGIGGAVGKRVSPETFRRPPDSGRAAETPKNRDSQRRSPT